MERKTLFADILLPLPVEGCFTYRVPFDLNGNIRVGQRAVVPFGRNRVYAGLVRNIHEIAPVGYTVRYLHALLDDQAVVTPEQFAFWKWVASYYLCTEGEVMNAALPPGMKLAGETRVALHSSGDDPPEGLSEKEQALYVALKEKNHLTLTEASKTIGMPKVLPLIKGMMEKGLLVVREELDNPWRPKTEVQVGLNERYTDEEELREVFEKTGRKAPRQLEVLMKFFQLTDPSAGKRREVSRSLLIGDLKGGGQALKALVKQGVFDLSTKEVSYFDHLDGSAADVVLSADQQQAKKEIEEGFSKRDVVLLHGVTSSGKTALYLELIREVMDRGEQVLYLLPEIALTAQIIRRLQQQFGNRAGIYHSRFNPLERSEVWNNLLYEGVTSGDERIRYGLVLGPRSAIFLPFKKLGLIIIDEEHEPSYKQHDPAPRYHARDAAIYLAASHGAKVLLGSATPSLEVFSNAETGKFGYASISKRYGGVMLPELLVADIRKDTRSKAMKSHFSPLLIGHMQQALDDGEQVILFQNRRGFSLRLECDVCQWLPQCHQCDVSLVYHKKDNRLRCHYCGYHTSPPGTCPSCNSTAVKMKGFGTEKIEDELPAFFPDARICRMDMDTTRSKNAYRRIIEDFENHKIDILVGTQMVSKGLDFKKVGVVGILNADNLLNFPDFRAHERAFQLMAQVSGRAGRDQKRGKVIIQTYNPGHPVIRQVVDHNYEEMFRQQIVERRQFGYPPFKRLVRVSLLHPDEGLLNKASSAMAVSLSGVFPGKVFGPEYPLVSRIRNHYIQNILIKLERSPKLSKEKEQVQTVVREFQKDRRWKQVRVMFNVDPV